MSYQYLSVDSRGNRVAHALSDDGPERPVWVLQLDEGDVKSVLSHEYISLVGTSETIPAIECRIARREGSRVTVERVRELGESVR